MDFATAAANVEEPEAPFMENSNTTGLTKINDTSALATADFMDGSNDKHTFIKQEVVESESNDSVSVSGIANTAIKKESSKIDEDGSLNSQREDQPVKSEVIFLPSEYYSDEDSESSNKPEANRHIDDFTNCNAQHDDLSKSPYRLKNRRQKIITCAKCNYKCTRKIDLKGHLQIHVGEKPFNCAFCDYKCARKSDLLRHSRTHTGEKPFTCTFCDYKCSQKAHLKKHLRYHTGEKPFSCAECDYKCFQKNQLVDHQIIHTGEKPLNCSLCDYKCIRKGDLTSHMRTHTGEKKFSCIHCNYRCYRKTNLIRHMRVHSKLVYSCTYCNYECLKQATFVAHLGKHTERNRRKGTRNNCDDEVEEVLRRFISTSNCEQEQVAAVKIESTAREDDA